MINYGTSQLIAPLSDEYVFQQKDIIEKKIEKSKEENWWDIFESATFWKGILAVAEIALGFIPGVGTFAQIGIGIGAAVVNTGIDVATNNLSASSIAIDFGTAFLPFAGKAIKHAKHSRKLKNGIYLIENSKYLKKGISVVKESFEIASKSIGNIDDAIKFNKNIIKTQKFPSKYLKDRKRFLKFLNTPKAKRTDAALLNVMNIKGSTDLEKKFPQLYGFLNSNQAYTTARYDKNQGLWYNFRKTQANRFITEENGNLKTIESTMRHLIEPKTILEKEIKDLYSKIDKILISHNTTINEISERADEFRKMLKNLQEIGKKNMNSKQQFRKSIEDAIPKRVLDTTFKLNVGNEVIESAIIQQVKSNNELKTLATTNILFSKRKRKLLEQMSKSEKMIKKTIHNLSDDDAVYFDALFNKVRHADYSKALKSKNISKEQVRNMLHTDIEAILKNISDDGLVSLHKATNSQNFNTLASNLENIYANAAGSKLKHTFMTRAIKYVGSSDFDEKIIQRVQNIFDSRDAGRYTIERFYQWIQKIINKFIERKFLTKALDKAAKTVKKGVVTRERMYQKTGTVIITSRYIHSYKVLYKSGKYFKVLVRFRKLATQPKNKKGFNKNGKPPVIVDMSAYDLKNLREIGGTYWKDQGTLKGWERNRGGRKATSLSRFFNDDIALFLGAVPIQPLRRMLSLVSNIVEGTYDFATGTYFDGYKEKFATSFLNTFKNRFGRLITRVATSGFLKTSALKKLDKSILNYNSVVKRIAKQGQSGSNFLSRNVQKVGSLLLSNARFTFDKQGKLTINSKNYGTKLRKQAIRNYLPTLARSGLIFGQSSKLRRIKGSSFVQSLSRGERNVFLEKQANLGRQLQSDRRKLQQVFRIKSAVTPGIKGSGLSKSFKQLTKFKI